MTSTPATDPATSPVRPADLSDLPVAAETVTQAAAVTAQPPAGSLIVVAGPAATLVAPAVGEILAADPTDLVIAAPQAASWRREEFDTLVLAPASRATGPDRRNVIVVLAADRFGPLSERALKPVEEPQAPTWFVFATPTLSALTPTMRSRAAAHIVAAPASPARRVAALVDAGVEETVAARLVALAGDHVEVDLAITTHPDLATLACEVLTHPTVQARPLKVATHLTETFEPLAKALAGSVGSPAAGQALLARLLLSRWTDEVASSLRTVSGPNGFTRAEAKLTLIDEGLVWLDRNVPPAQVLSTVLAGLA